MIIVCIPSKVVYINIALINQIVVFIREGNSINITTFYSLPNLFYKLRSTIVFFNVAFIINRDII